MRTMALFVMLSVLLCASACAQSEYYYNPDGGRYYHANRHCDSISEKYWAVLREIAESELEIRGLKRCGRCAGEAPRGTLADSPVHILGGSEADVIRDVIWSNEGYLIMTGFTCSSDGSLASRTKSGKSGWLVCVDTQGHTLFNFCSRQGHNDYMSAPVVHEDGTMTVLLRAQGNERHLVELIRLSDKGEVISRKTLMEENNSGNVVIGVEEPGVFCGGYVISRLTDERGRRAEYVCFDFDGNRLGSFKGEREGSLMAVSRRHSIQAEDGTIWLCSLDASGNAAKLTPIFDGQDGDMVYTDLVSLDDGGAIGCAQVMQGDIVSGRLTRWIADGSVAFEATLEDGLVPDDLCRAENGFFLTCFTGARGIGIYSGYAALRLDEQGNVIAKETLSYPYDHAASPLAAIEGDRAAVALAIQNGSSPSGQMVNFDVHLTIMQLK